MNRRAPEAKEEKKPKCRLKASYFSVSPFKKGVTYFIDNDEKLFHYRAYICVLLRSVILVSYY